MTDITGLRGRHLRTLIKSARKDGKRWAGEGFPRGLSQKEVANRIGKSQIWVRQIESAYVDSAPATTIASMCYALGIDSVLVRAIGFPDVADAIDAIVMMRESEIPDYVLEAPRLPTWEEHLRATPDLTEAQKELLVDAVRQMGRMEPLGQEIWTRRSARRRKGRG